MWGSRVRPRGRLVGVVVDHDHLSAGFIRLHDAVGLLDIFEAEHSCWLRPVTACLHIGRNTLQRNVRQGEARLPEHEAAEEGQVDTARHLQQRIEVGDRREAAQPTGQASASAPAQHGEGIEDGAVADQVEHGVDLPGLRDSFGKVRSLDLRPDRAERRQRWEPVTAAGGGDDLRSGVDRHVERRLAERRGRPTDHQGLARAISRLRNRQVQAVA